MLVVSIAYSQQDTQQSQNEQAQEDTENRNSKGGGRVFKPSEEISEDSPVPFPVDI